MFATSALRPARAFAVRFNPAMLAPCTSTSTASTSAFSHTTRPTASFASLPLSLRPASTTTSNSTRTTSANPASPSSSTTSRSQLTWNDFLALRRTRRKISVVSSGFTSILVAYGGLRVFIENGYDGALSATLGLDPLMVTGLSCIGMLAAGWLVGPIFGGALFNLRYRGMRGEIMNKEREFYNRIKSHRVDPTSSSIANPVPDYYGEKIGSVAGYRRWLKDQRAFNLKRGAYQGSK